MEMRKSVIYAPFCVEGDILGLFAVAFNKEISSAGEITKMCGQAQITGSLAAVAKLFRNLHTQFGSHQAGPGRAGGTRTHTGVTPEDFKSPASAISPPPHAY